MRRPRLTNWAKWACTLVMAILVAAWLAGGWWTVLIRRSGTTWSQGNIQDLWVARLEMGALSIRSWTPWLTSVHVLPSKPPTWRLAFHWESDPGGWSVQVPLWLPFIVM